MLARAWNAIRARHHDVPPVVLVIGSRSSRLATRCRLGHFSPMRWVPPDDQHGSTDLQAAMDVVNNAMNDHDLIALQAALQASATAVLQNALQLSSDARASLSEVLITQDGLTNRATEVLATLAHEAAHSVAWQRGINDTSRQGRYHNHRFQKVAEELGLQVQRDSAFGWTQTDLRASTAAAYSGVLKELELHVPRARSPSAAGGNERARGGVRTLACPCGHRLIRDGQSRFLADATICTGCLVGTTSAGWGWRLSTCCGARCLSPSARRRDRGPGVVLDADAAVMR